MRGGGGMLVAGRGNGGCGVLGVGDDKTMHKMSAEKYEHEYLSFSQEVTSSGWHRDSSVWRNVKILGFPFQ